MIHARLQAPSLALAMLSISDATRAELEERPPAPSTVGESLIMRAPDVEFPSLESMLAILAPDRSPLPWRDQKANPGSKKRGLLKARKAKRKRVAKSRRRNR